MLSLIWRSHCRTSRRSTYAVQRFMKPYERPIQTSHEYEYHPATLRPLCALGRRVAAAVAQLRRATAVAGGPADGHLPAHVPVRQPESGITIRRSRGGRARRQRSVRGAVAPQGTGGPGVVGHSQSRAHVHSPRGAGVLSGARATVATTPVLRLLPPVGGLLLANLLQKGGR